MCTKAGGVKSQEREGEQNGGMENVRGTGGGKGTMYMDLDIHQYGAVPGTITGQYG